MKIATHLIAPLVMVAWVAAASADYSEHPQLDSFVSRMANEHQFDVAELRKLFAEAEQKESILKAIARPAEKVLSWAEYQDIFIQDRRISGGVKFWNKNEVALNRAYETYGVAPEIIVSILGVETRYGGNTGDHRVIDALSTLAFDFPPRASFFRKELEHFLLLAREQKQNPLSLTGSYAGAMGYGQFMPSSYRAYAVDFDGNGFVDIWQSETDAIGSVANYLARHGWEKDGLVASRARTSEGYTPDVLTRGLELKHKVRELKKAGIHALDPVAEDKAALAFKLEGKRGAEFWIGLKNFEVITRYNRSQLYAMAVFQLSQEIERARQQRGG